MARRFTKKELVVFRGLLLKKRGELTGTIFRLGEEALPQQKGKNGDLSALPSHIADQGTENFNQDFALGLLESESSALEEIDQALERIREGTFGVCEVCERLIPKARLRARPQASLCLECKQREELGLF
ncbi:MAG: TraR/DksA C4-type zinc finger protein [Planctomycetes bacterium]|nr:TraR/DksA C4-type zinc finger protein [Planctomycetota bacterium]